MENTNNKTFIKDGKKFTELSPCLVELCNKRGEEIENLKEVILNLKSKNEELEHLVKHLKTEMRVARSFLEYESNADIRQSTTD